MAIFLNQQVGWLDVSMNNPVAMGKGQGFGGFDANAGYFIRYDTRWRIAQQILQRLSFDSLHGVPMHAFVVSHGVDGDDVGMVQCGSRFRFALKPFDRDRVDGCHRQDF